ncbi:MAG: cytochrome c biogenesis CcdA family protein, partial [Methanobacteriota archaeon]
MLDGALTPAVALVAGAVSFFAPCILPVVPGYLAFVTGGPDASPRRRRVLTIAFVSGFSVAFVTLGLLVGSVGGGGFFDVSATLLQRIAGAIVIAFGLVLLGLLRVPFFDRDLRFHGRVPASLGPVGGAAVLGAAFGVGWTPCAGPVLASILVLAGVGGSAFSGAVLLGFYAAGLAVPFMVLGFSADRGAAFLRRVSNTARGIEIVGGIFLIALGIAIFTGATARLTSYLVG